jgi:hypothetical protein
MNLAGAVKAKGKFFQFPQSTRSTASKENFGGTAKSMRN